MKMFKVRLEFTPQEFAVLQHFAEIAETGVVAFCKQAAGHYPYLLMKLAEAAKQKSEQEENK